MDSPVRYEPAAPWEIRLEGSNPDIAAVAVNSHGEVHLLTRSPHPVLVFDDRGRFLRSWGNGVFSTTHGMHVGPDDCVYIVDAADSTVRKFSPSGELLLTLGQPFQTSETGYRDGDFRTIDRGGPPFNAPTGVAIGPDNDIYVSDGYGNASIHRFSEFGDLRRSWGGAGRGQFRTPHGIFVTGDGTVYVADRENDRVQRFTADGAFLGEWTDANRPAAVFCAADGTALVAEMGYIAGLVVGMPEPTRESHRSRISVRDSNGRVVGIVGATPDPDSSPCDPGNFLAAHAVWADATGNVYVTEVINARAKSGPGAVPLTCHAFQMFRRV
jgi:DNA-binding beta-propeller fold protein YncE